MGNGVGVSVALLVGIGVIVGVSLGVEVAVSLGVAVGDALAVTVWQGPYWQARPTVDRSRTGRAEKERRSNR